MAAKSKHPLYQTWWGMVRRCEQASHATYPYYGARGIRVCGRWRQSFDAFLADMGPKPSAAHSLDRVDMNGDYEPSNVRWGTRNEQAKNRRVQALADVVKDSCPAHPRFRAWLESAGVSQSLVATNLRVSTASFCCWVTGETRPDCHYRVAIERVTGIPADDWMRDDEYFIAYGESRDRRCIESWTEPTVHPWAAVER